VTKLLQKTEKLEKMSSRNNNYVETIVREVKKIGRNEKVNIKNVTTGETKTLKYKLAENFIKKGEWIIFNE